MSLLPLMLENGGAKQAVVDDVVIAEAVDRLSLARSREGAWQVQCLSLGRQQRSRTVVVGWT
jgi:hypothetical protein